MKRFLLLAALICSVEVQAQSILRNSLNTNTLGTNLVWNPSTLRLRASGATPSIELWNTSGTANFRRFIFNNATDQLRVEWSNDAGSMSLLLSTWSSDGNFAPLTLSLSGETNRLSIANDQLLLDGVQVSGGSESAPVNNFYSTNNFFINGKGNTLVVTQSVTFQFIKTNLLATDANGLVTTTKFGSGISWDPATQTISSTASGGGLTEAVTTLTYSGTNAVGFDCSTNGMSYYILLTNHVLFGSSTFASLPAKTAYRTFTLCLQQDSAGGYVPKFTNSIVAWSEGVQVQVTTNANAVSYVYFHTSLATNSMLVGSGNVNIQ